MNLTNVPLPVADTGDGLSKVHLDSHLDFSEPIPLLPILQACQFMIIYWISCLRSVLGGKPRGIGTGWSLRSFATQTIQGFCEKFCWISRRRMENLLLCLNCSGRNRDVGFEPQLHLNIYISLDSISFRFLHGAIYILMKPTNNSWIKTRFLSKIQLDLEQSCVAASDSNALKLKGINIICHF